MLVRVGAVQAEPVWYNLEAGVNKTITLIEEAGKRGDSCPVGGSSAQDQPTRSSTYAEGPFQTQLI